MKSIEVHDLFFRYPRAEADVLYGLNFEVEPGEVFGFLGPNGSGKTTTQLLLTRILRGYRGEIRILGRDLGEVGAEFYEEIGVSFEVPNLYEKLTAEENLLFFQGFFGKRAESTEGLLRRLDLPVGDRRTVRQFSKGMRMRVVLARSLLNRPRVWFLDEPTSGQDPEHAVEIRRVIRERADAGTTVFLTTHNMELADSLCDRVAFLANGGIRRVAPPRDLKLEFSRRRIRVRYRFGGQEEVRDYSLEEPREKAAFLDFVRDHEVESIHTLEPSLEDVFLQVTGTALG